MLDQLPSLAGVSFLNAGTCGPMPQAALEAMRAEAEFQVGNPRISRKLFDRVMEGRERARAAAARSVGARTEDVALTNSTSQGVATVVGAIDWQAGDRVVTTTDEHPGITAPLATAAARYGVEVIEVPPAEVVPAVVDGIRLVALSHVLWTTGVELDLPAIAQAAHKVGARLLVDGAQSAGNITVDVTRSGADYYAFSGQKWLLGPMGSGALWVRDDVAGDMHPPMPSYLSIEHDGSGNYRPGALRLDAGMIDPATLARVRRSGGMGRVASRRPAPRGQATAAAKVAAARDRLERGRRARGRPQRQRPARAHRIAGGRPRTTRWPTWPSARCWRARSPTPNYIRVSIGAWTAPEDIDALIAGLRGDSTTRPRRAAPARRRSAGVR